MGRRIIRIDESGISMAREARFESEAQLHTAVATHPEVLPNEDFGIGPLVRLATELDLGSGPMDLLATDGQGRLVIVEFKRGTENPDIRQVIAQLLDYGSSLWRTTYDELEAECRRLDPGMGESLADAVSQRLAALDEPCDSEAFTTGVESCLASGAFTYVYCGRNLDERTRRIMTYLAEGPRMSVFAVEMEYYREHASQNAVLVPRTAFVPSWITGPDSADPRGKRRAVSLVDASPEFQALVAHMDALAEELGLQVRRAQTGWNYLPPVLEEGVPHATTGVGIYASRRGVEINIAVLRELGQSEVADELLQRWEAVTGIPMKYAQSWPSAACSVVLPVWERARAEVIEPYFKVRMGEAKPDAL